MRICAKGIKEGTVTSYKDILSQAVEDKVASASEVPFFEDGFWPDFLEETGKQDKDQNLIVGSDETKGDEEPLDLNTAKEVRIQ